MKKRLIVCLALICMLTGCKEKSLGIYEEVSPSIYSSSISLVDVNLEQDTTVSTTLKPTVKIKKTTKKTTSTTTTTMVTTTQTTVATTTAKKEVGYNFVSTYWEYVGSNGNYKYIHFAKDETGIDDFAFKYYDTKSQYVASACHFRGFGNIINNTKSTTIFQLDDGTEYTMTWINANSFKIDDTTYTKVVNKVNTSNINECE